MAGSNFPQGDSERPLHEAMKERPKLQWRLLDVGVERTMECLLRKLHIRGKRPCVIKVTELG